MKATKDQIKNLKPLIKRADFLKIGKNGAKCVSHGVILQAMPNDLGFARIGFTVNKKTEMSAVKRNRIKRRLRAAAADILSLHARESADYVLIGRQGTSVRPYETLCNDLKYCLEKTGYAK
jgi:ribonuclease P protein component